VYSVITDSLDFGEFWAHLVTDNAINTYNYWLLYLTPLLANVQTFSTMPQGVYAQNLVWGQG